MLLCWSFVEGHAVRIVPCSLVIACLFLTSTGCSLFNKRPKEDAAATKKGGKEPAQFPTAGGDPIRDSSVTSRTEETSTLLAGTVLDEYNQHPREAYVRWASLDDPKKDAAPIDVAVSPEGYFTIRGLKANQNYRLTARAKDGNRMLAGVAYVKAPDIHIVIRLRADLANSETPPIPGPPAYTPPKQEEPAKTSTKPIDRQAVAGGPAWSPGNPSPASIGTPRPVNVPDLQAPVSIPTPTTPAPSPPPPSGGWVPGIVAINNPIKSPATIERPTPMPAPAPSGPTATATRVPSCILVGNNLINFALYDLTLQPWEYKTHKKGKLLLLDFWGTWCVPCQKTIPQLVSLQTRYGADGLEIIGIAYEREGSPAEQARRVGNASQARQINYRVLLGGEGTCPVRNQFAISAIPTLILIDQNGWIIWRHEGLPDRAHAEELEFVIKRQLGIRP